jgi:hypothetical protein
MRKALGAWSWTILKVKHLFYLTNKKTLTAYKQNPIVEFNLTMRSSFPYCECFTVAANFSSLLDRFPFSFLFPAFLKSSLLPCLLRRLQADLPPMTKYRLIRNLLEP